MNKEEILELLKNSKRILISFQDYGYSREYSSSFPYFNLYILREDYEIVRIIDPNHPYWSKRKGCFGMKIWGTDRVWELLEHYASGNVEITRELYNKTFRLYI
jgi:hypothetical protein